MTLVNASTDGAGGVHVDLLEDADRPITRVRSLSFSNNPAFPSRLSPPQEIVSHISDLSRLNNIPTQGDLLLLKQQLLSSSQASHTSQAFQASQASQASQKLSLASTTHTSRTSQTSQTTQTTQTTNASVSTPRRGHGSTLSTTSNQSGSLRSERNSDSLEDEDVKFASNNPTDSTSSHASHRSRGLQRRHQSHPLPFHYYALSPDDPDIAHHTQSTPNTSRTSNSGHSAYNACNSYNNAYDASPSPSMPNASRSPANRVPGRKSGKHGVRSKHSKVSKTRRNRMKQRNSRKLSSTSRNFKHSKNGAVESSDESDSLPRMTDLADIDVNLLRAISNPNLTNSSGGIALTPSCTQSTHSDVTENEDDTAGAGAARDEQEARDARETASVASEASDNTDDLVDGVLSDLPVPQDTATLQRMERSLSKIRVLPGTNEIVPSKAGLDRTNRAMTTISNNGQKNGNNDQRRRSTGAARDGNVVNYHTFFTSIFSVGATDTNGIDADRDEKEMDQNGNAKNRKESFRDKLKKLDTEQFANPNDAELVSLHSPNFGQRGSGRMKKDAGINQNTRNGARESSKTADAGALLFGLTRQRSNNLCDVEEDETGDETGADMISKGKHQKSLSFGQLDSSISKDNRALFVIKAGLTYQIDYGLPEGPFTLYVFDIKYLNNIEWSIKKRYSDFLRFHKEIEPELKRLLKMRNNSLNVDKKANKANKGNKGSKSKKKKKAARRGVKGTVGNVEDLQDFGADADDARIAMKMPKLPGKTFRKCFEASFVSERHCKLTAYLNGILRISPLVASNISVLTFLGAVDNMTQKYNNKFLESRMAYTNYISELADTGDIVLFQTKGYLAAGLRTVSMTNYDHVGVVCKVPAKKDEFYEELYLLEATADGVRKYKLQKRLRQWSILCPQIVVRRKLGAKTDEFYNLAKTFVSKVDGLEYSIWSNLSKLGTEALDIDKHKKYFCSQLVTAFLRYTKSITHDIKVSIVLPGHFSDTSDKSSEFLKEYTNETLLLFKLPAVQNAKRKLSINNGGSPK